MSRLTIVLLCAGLMGSAMAADAPGKAPAQGAPEAAKGAQPAGPDQVIADILSASGTKTAFENLPKSFADRFHKDLQEAEAKKGASIPPELQQAMESTVKDAFTAQGFTARASRAMKQDYDEKKYQELLADLSTPLARRMAELGSKGDPSEQELGAFLTQMANNPLPAQRIDLIHRLDVALRASDLVSTIVLSSNRGVLRGIAGANGKCPSEGQIARAEAAMVQQMEETKDGYSGAMQTSLTYAYRDASDADLAEYVRIYEKANAKHVRDVIYGATVEEYGDASARMGHAIMKAIRANVAASGSHACDGVDAPEKPGKPRVAAAGQTGAASGAAPATAQPAGAMEGSSTEGGATPKSSIPLDKRKGGDITQCLGAGSDKDIAACAEKFRPKK